MSASIEMTSSKTVCSVPQNQPIYQALLDKAATYPADKPYQAKAYKKAAESILSYDTNIYDAVTKSGYFAEPTFVGEKIADFIYDFVKNTSVTADVPKPVASAPSAEPQTVRQIDAWWKNWAESQKPVVYTAENPRRSGRNTSKTVKYYSPEDEMMDVEDAILAYCEKKGFTYSDDLITEFYQYCKNPATTYFGKKYNWRTNIYEDTSITEKATWWAKYKSTSINNQLKDIKLRNTINKYCTKNNIQFDPIIVKKYNDWVADPVNDKLINKTYTSYACSCSSCSANNTTRPNESYTYPINTFNRVNKFFSTLKKTIVW